MCGVARRRQQTPFRETDLYAPVRDMLAAQGFVVRGEVNGCDLTAQRGDELVVVELKRSFGTSLLVQAADRQRLTDSVYVALPRPAEGIRTKRWRGILHLLRRLELGLILVALDSPGARVEIVFHPVPFDRRKQSGRRRAVLAEMDGRSGDHNPGGSARRKLMTAYRENALRIACCLERTGPSSPRRLRELGCGPKTGAILGSDFYGWFERVERGIYRLRPAGRAALDEFAAVTEGLRREIEAALSALESDDA